MLSPHPVTVSHSSPTLFPNKPEDTQQATHSFEKNNDNDTINSKDQIDHLESLRNSDHSNSTGCIKQTKVIREKHKDNDNEKANSDSTIPEPQNNYMNNITNSDGENKDGGSTTEETKPRERKALKSKRKPVTMMSLADTLDSSNNTGLGSELHLGFH